MTGLFFPGVRLQLPCGSNDRDALSFIPGKRMLSWQPALVSIFLSALVAGCASNPAERKADEEFAGMTTEQRISMCTRIYRDVRVACRDGLHDQKASQSLECLSAQLQLDRHCLIPR